MLIGQSNEAQNAYAAFLESQKELSYTLGDISGTPEGDMLQYTELKIAAEKEKVANAKIANDYQAALAQAQLDYEAVIAGIRTTYGA